MTSSIPAVLENRLRLPLLPSKLDEIGIEAIPAPMVYFTVLTKSL